MGYPGTIHFTPEFTMFSELGYDDDYLPLPNLRPPNRKLATSVVDERIRKAYDGRIERVTTYHTAQTKCQFKCNVCGTYFWRTPENMFGGHRTPCRCGRSKRWIRERLDNV